MSPWRYSIITLPIHCVFGHSSLTTLMAMLTNWTESMASTSRAWVGGGMARIEFCYRPCVCHRALCVRTMLSPPRAPNNTGGVKRTTEA